MLSCDRCVAQAQVWFVLVAQELAMCHHHAREHREALEAAGWRELVPG